MTEEKYLASTYFERAAIERVIPGDYVVMLVFHEKTGKFLLVKEGEDNQDFGRKAGTWNTVCETFKKDDVILLRSCRRAIKEEIDKEDRFPHLFKFIPGSYDSYHWNDGHKIHRVVFRFSGDQSPQIFSSENLNEIMDYKWVSFPELVKMTIQRQVVPFVLPFVMNHKIKGTFPSKF